LESKAIHGLKEHKEHVKVAEEYQDIINDNRDNHKLFNSVGNV
jgi:S-adenosylmethionine:tRNA-ribosyltransferase-isomerase (queuine synthetase)